MKMPTTTLIQEKAQTDALFHSIGEGAIATDAAGNISRINPAALMILGYREEETLGKWFPGMIVAVNEEGQKISPLNRAITRAVMSGASISEKAFYRTAGGKTIPVFVTVSPVIHDGKPIGAIEVFRDISKEFEVDRLKSEFISIASHQLRTPATAVKNFIGLLKDGYAGDLTEEQTMLIEQAYESNEMQLEIVNNLLYAARAEDNQVRLKLSRNDLVGLVTECIDDHLDVIKQRKQTIDVSLPDDAIEIIMDRQFIRMLIENLITNASKYTEDGGQLEVKLERNKHFLTLQVTDTGVGIAPNDIQKLFHRFSRIENELSTTRGGSGIGLYLAKRIAELHNYQLAVVSEEGKGSTFMVHIPRSN